MDKEIIDKVMFDNFLRSVPTMVVDAKDRKTISAYGHIDVNDLRSAIDTFKKVPEYGELLKQVKKQKEVIDKAIDFYEIYKQECVTGRTRDERLIKDYYLPAHLSKKLINILKGDDYVR